MTEEKTQKMVAKSLQCQSLDDLFAAAKKLKDAGQKFNLHCQFDPNYDVPENCSLGWEIPADQEQALK